MSRPFEEAPRDGRLILVDEGGVLNSVRYYEYDPEIAEEVGEDGFFSYADTLLGEHEVEVPFTWFPAPEGFDDAP
ncbi:hypothetical protein MHM88_14215 [Epibacterium sp. MM17-32]|uniref:hypothetical protein n=1 Tax=Epibacterium sp. MM17-32 TaxID=2917734 RepID=UPI001EF4BA78|nr:hypothetical protein [Epibacterium sp. MM17-32]MCG7628962.1 hypothetical protein [Epibacterium sp. MM17-32]